MPSSFTVAVVRFLALARQDGGSCSAGQHEVFFLSVRYANMPLVLLIVGCAAAGGRVVHGPDASYASGSHSSALRWPWW